MKPKDIIKQWYIKNYPTDEMGIEMKETLTFEELFTALDNYQDVYQTMGVHDSVIRERVFEELSKVMQVDYDYIYDQWLKS